MPLCYHIEDFSLMGAQLSVRLSTHAAATNLAHVLEVALPDAFCRVTSDPYVFFSDETITITGTFDRRVVIELLELMRSAVSVCDDCDVSQCLDFYRSPDPAAPDQEPRDWAYSHNGEQMKLAKYEGQRQPAAANAAGEALGDELLRFVKSHPVFSRASAVASVPRSSPSNSRVDWPIRWAKKIAIGLDVPTIALSRSRYVRAQKDLTTDDERRANQHGSMFCERASGAILVLDDLYMTGRTMAEACRAARTAGATLVLGLAATKTRKGARGAW